MIAIGIGCRKGCPADEIVGLVRDARTRLPPHVVPAGLFSVADKAQEAGLAEAATILAMPLAFFDHAVLAVVSSRAESRSPRIEAMFGLPSIAETAALAGAGDGAVLLVPRLASAQATCAIAGPSA